MSNLVQELLSIKSPYNDFIERPELIQGYTGDEIKPLLKEKSILTRTELVAQKII